MVTEHAFNDPRDKGDSDEPPGWINSPESSDDGEDDPRFVGDSMPVGLGPLEVERWIKTDSTLSLNPKLRSSWR